MDISAVASKGRSWACDMRGEGTRGEYVWIYSFGPLPEPSQDSAAHVRGAWACCSKWHVARGDLCGYAGQSCCV